MSTEQIEIPRPKMSPQLLKALVLMFMVAAIDPQFQKHGITFDYGTLFDWPEFPG